MTRRRIRDVARATLLEFVRRVVVDPVRAGRLRDVDWPLGLRPIAVVALVGYVASGALVLLSGPLREWLPLAAQPGIVPLILPRALVWVVFACTALSATLAASGALHVRPWLRWATTAFVALVVLFVSISDPSDVPWARFCSIAACIGLVVFVALRGGRGFRWTDFLVITLLVWVPIIVTAASYTSVNRALGYDFIPVMLSLMLSSLGQLAVPAALAAGATVAGFTVSSALWAAKIVRRVIGARAIFVVLGIVAAWRVWDVTVTALGLPADAQLQGEFGAAAALLVLISAAWVVLARVRRGRGMPSAQGMADRIDGLALVVAACTTTSLPATPLIVLSQVVIGYGAPQEIAHAMLLAADLMTTTVAVFGVRLAGACVLLVLAVLQARRGRRTTPELMASVGVAMAFVAIGVLFGAPPAWGSDALAALGAVLALGVLVVLAVRRSLNAGRATWVLIALLMSALFAYREFVTDPIAFLLGFAGGAVVLFGFVWSFLTGYEQANGDSRAYPRPARVQLVLANALFGITILAFVALARDPDAAMSLGDFADAGAQLYGDPLVASGLLVALWAALRGRPVDDAVPADAAPEADAEAPQNAGASTASSPRAEKASDSAV